MKRPKWLGLCLLIVLCAGGLLLLCLDRTTSETPGENYESTLGCGIENDFAFFPWYRALVHVSVERVFPGTFERRRLMPDRPSLLIEGQVIHDFFAPYRQEEDAPWPWIEEGEPLYLWIDLRGNSLEEREAYGKELEDFFQTCDSLIVYGLNADDKYRPDDSLVVRLEELAPELTLVEEGDWLSLLPAITVVENDWFLIPIQDHTFALDAYHQVLGPRMMLLQGELLYWGPDGQTEEELYDTAREIARISAEYELTRKEREAQYFAERYGFR